MTDLPKAFSQDVMAVLARPVMTHDPRAAQIDGGVPKWHVIEVASREVEAELIKRRFGIYVPEEDETVIVRGRQVTRRNRMFPGYVFVFLWETDANWSKLAALHGVVADLGVLSDVEIDRIRHIENCARPIVLESFEIERDVVPKKRRKRRKTKRQVVIVHDEVTAVRPWSAFEDAITTLDSEGRNQALRELLGISS